jgi:hypothetical protein
LLIVYLRSFVIDLDVPFVAPDAGRRVVDVNRDDILVSDLVQVVQAVA